MFHHISLDHVLTQEEATLVPNDTEKVFSLYEPSTETRTECSSPRTQNRIHKADLVQWQLASFFLLCRQNIHEQLLQRHTALAH